MFELLESNLNTIVGFTLNNPWFVFFLTINFIAVRYIPVLRDLIVALFLTFLTGFILHPIVANFIENDFKDLIVIYSIFGSLFFVAYSIICVYYGSINYNKRQKYNKIIKIYKEEIDGGKDLKKIIKVIEEDSKV